MRSDAIGFGILVYAIYTVALAAALYLYPAYGPSSPLVFGWMMGLAGLVFALITAEIYNDWAAGKEKAQEKHLRQIIQEECQSK